jgi:hypothetical protein
MGLGSVLAVAGAQEVVAMMVGLSLPQPKPWAILRGGSRVINLPAGMTLPRHRGEVLIHAAASVSHDAFDEANREMLSRGALPSGVLLPWRADLPRGGFVGKARIVDIVRVDIETGHAFTDADRCFCKLGDVACAAINPWLTPGTRALVLADVEPLAAFVPARAPTVAALPFHVDGEVFDRALAMAMLATTDEELDAVAAVWREAASGRQRTRVAQSAGMAGELAEARA